MSQTSEHTEPAPGGPAPVLTPSGPAWSRLIGLLIVFGALTLLAVASGSFAVVAFVLALIACVTLHEAGHFLTAKWAGMKVTEFFFGFGPRLWSFRRGETEYGVKALPAGGYVKILGMSNLEKDIDPADEPRTYRQQSYPRRVLVAVAGICTHFIIAFLLLVIMWSAIGVQRPSLTIGSITQLENSGPSPAQQAGFRPGDQLVALDGRPVEEWGDVYPYIRANPGKEITFTISRGGEQLTLVAAPAPIDQDGESVGFMGIGSRLVVEKVNPLQGAARAVGDIGRLTVASAKALGAFFSPASLADYGDQLTGGSGSGDARPVSVVGVARLADQAAQQGLFDFLSILVLLNIFVAVFNMVPLLPLDGGHIAIATYERIRSRNGKAYRADVQKLLPITAAVVVLLVTLGVTSLWLDIVNPVNNPFQ